MKRMISLLLRWGSCSVLAGRASRRAFLWWSSLCIWFAACSLPSAPTCPCESAAIGKGQIVSRIPVRIVFVRNRAKRKDWIALISTDMDISEEEIIRRYGVRWNIEVYFKTCKQHLKLLRESNSPSFDAFTCHLAIVCVRYMILAVNQRAASDDRTLGELFWLMTAEAAEISFTKTLALILEALLDAVREFVAISDVQMQAFTHSFLAKLPQHLRAALGIPHPSVAA